MDEMDFAGYETAGDFDGDMGAVIIPQRRNLPPPRRALPRNLNAAALQRAARAMPQPTQASVEARVRAIVRDELARSVPYGDIPARPTVDALFPMGLGSGTLTNVVTSITLTAQPQRAFRGERLVLAIQRSSGAANVLVALTDFAIGDYKQTIGGGSIPADVFAQDAFGVRLSLDGSAPGVLYSLTFTATVPGGESIVVSGAVIGSANEAAAR